jgi:hypothetical protein
VSSRFGRFGKLEPERRSGEEAAPRRPSVEDRFGTSEPAAQEGPSPGAEDDGQLVVCCALCHTDAEATAEACPSCGASFSTPEQRAFNEALEKRRSHARELRARAEAEAAEARRVREERLREQAEARQQEAATALERARTSQESFQRDPVGHVAREIGGALGAALGRAFPHPLARVAFVLGCLGFVMALAWIVPAVRGLLCLGFLVVFILATVLNRAVRIFGRF